MIVNGINVITETNFNLIRNDNTTMKWRRNGKTKLWKTRPTEFSIPVKHGINGYGYITQLNIHLYTKGN